MATEARIMMMKMTIMSSSSVNPREFLVLERRIRELGRTPTFPPHA
jgi:hypothetical protein